MDTVLVIDILTHILLTLLTFIALPNLRKVSICYVIVQFTSLRVIDGPQFGEQI